MDSSRIKQVNALILSKLSFSILDYIGGNIASIVRVDTSSDLSSSKIYISVLNDDQKIVDQLNFHAKEIRKDLAGKIKLRIIPNFRFILDLNESYAEKVDNLFKKL
ncbi:MAG: ribosome-binding factor A [Patescibacteria group bacterium]|jgi:ribosome-binding factor A